MEAEQAHGTRAMLAGGPHPDRLDREPGPAQERRRGRARPHFAPPQVRAPPQEDRERSGREKERGHRLREDRESVEDAGDKVETRSFAGAEKRGAGAGEQGQRERLRHDVQRFAQKRLVGEHTERDRRTDPPAVTTPHRDVRDDREHADRELLHEGEEALDPQSLEDAISSAKRGGRPV